ncbi:related to acetylornithine aminotransferase [Rhynchosporium graminicola]|uniref:Related to acetylornithine aminotransferase n=1 Tax=Rhynchosporium graminicola TaxID=2792576 RepID=A0A1E1LHP4_9HELO|nr:related to acetylornithine aminotransferase [Rhynchosporium commune]
MSFSDGMIIDSDNPLTRVDSTGGTSPEALLSSLVTVQQEYSLMNCKSLEAHDEACLDFPGGNTRTVLHTSPFPITFSRGEGAELTSLDGKVYVDFLGEYTAGIYGHSNKKIKEAVREAMGIGWNFGGPNLYERELARKVTRRFAPSGIELVRFTNSGTESNTMALAAAVAFTKRKNILVLKNGYHGGTLSFPLSLNAINTNLPHDFVLAPYNDIEGTKSALSFIPRGSSAAILVEGVQGSGGCVVGNPEFLHFLNTTAHELGALFIMDEVMTSRLAYHGFSASLGLKPDLITLGKWVGGGMTFGAFGGRRDVMSQFDPQIGVLGHSGTFNNNVVTMAAGCVGLDIYNEAEVERLNALGNELRHSIEDLLLEYEIRALRAGSKSISFTAEKRELECPFYGIVPSGKRIPASQLQKNSMGVTGQGSMLAVHFYGPSEKILLSLFWHYMLSCGIYIAARGFITLNLELTKEHVVKFVESTRGFIIRYQDALK